MASTPSARGAVICWPQQTSEQPGGQRAGKKVVLEQADLDMVKQTAPLVKHVCLETVRRPGHRLRRSHGGNGAGARRLSRIWRDAQRSPVRRPLDQRRGRTGAAARDLSGRTLKGEVIQRTPCRGRDRTGRGRALHGDRRDGAQDSAQQLFLERRRIFVDSVFDGRRFVEHALRRSHGV